MENLSKTNHNKGWLNWMVRVFSFFSRKKSTPPEVQEAGNAPESSRQENDIKKSLANFFRQVFQLSEDDEKLLESVNSHILFITEMHHGLGYNDGKYGARDFTIGVSARSRATQLTEHIYSRIKGKMDGLTVDIANKEQEKAKLEAEVESSRVFNQHMLDYSRKDYKSFSSIMGGMYVIFGFLLMLADIPISLSLVGNFGIGTTTSADPLEDKLLDFDKLIFALGIACSTIFIKLLYDQYINTPVGHWTRPVSEAKESDKAGIRVEQYVKLAVKLLILFALFFTFYNLGNFRNAYNGWVEGEPVKVEPNILSVRFWSFIGLTVVIPVISGVCLSVGLSILNNKKTLRQSSLLLNKLRSKYQAVGDECKALIVRRSQLSVSHDEWGKQAHKVDLISRQFICAYEQAYKKAYLVESGSDLFRMVAEYQAETTAIALRHQLNSKQ